MADALAGLSQATISSASPSPQTLPIEHQIGQAATPEACYYQF
jgi:hypothetical protein